MRLQTKRLFSQLFFLTSANLGIFGIKTGLCYPFFYCHSCPAAIAGCPLGVIEHSIYRGRLSLSLLLYPFLILGAICLIIGRAVCGWLCPIGLLQRATYPLSDKIRKRLGLPDLSPTLISRARYIKYGVFIVLVVVTTYTLGFMFTDICPVGFLVGTLPVYSLNHDKFVPNQFFVPALIVFILFIILIIISGRGWCKYFCPLGAIFALFNKISLLSVHVDKDKCVHCNICVKACPMGIDVPNMYRDPECILCGKCIDACPHGAISYRVGR